MELTALCEGCGVCPVPALPPAGASSAGSTRRWKTSLFFPVPEEAAMTVMLKDEPGPPTPPSLSSTHKLT